MRQTPSRLAVRHYRMLVVPAAVISFGLTLWIVRFAPLPFVPWLSHAPASDRWTVGSTAASLVATAVVGWLHRASHPVHTPVHPESAPGVAECFTAAVSKIADPCILGVHPARAGNDSGPERGDYPPLPPYVRRSFDHELRALLDRSRFVLLVGDAATGKTRSAWEALATCLPEHILVSPADRDAVGTAISEALGQKRCVLWLDSLYRLAGPEGLTSADVKKLTSGPAHRVIVATITVSDLATFGSRSDGAIREINRDVLQLARRILVPRMFDAEELARAERLASDPRIAGALRHREYGLPEYIAAGPEHYDSWQAEALGGGPHERGAALISAAVDCYRAGLRDSLTADLVERLHERYLKPRSGRSEITETLAEARHWATTVGLTTTALTIVEAADVRRVEVFGYLVDEYERQATVAQRVPDFTLEAALGEASATEAMRIGQTARDSGRYQIALLAFTQAAEDRRRRLGETDRNTLISRNKKARAIRALGRLQEARAEQESILAIQLEVRPRDDRDTLLTRDDLARTKRALGHYAEAAAEHLEVETARTTLLGPYHQDTLTSANNHARALRALGGYAESEAKHRAVMAARARVLTDPVTGIKGELHPDTINSRNDHARALYDLGRLAEAEAEHRATHEDRRHILGHDHPDTLMSLGDLARVHLAMDRIDLALEECTQTLNARTLVLGPDHHDTLNSRNDLARIKMAMGLLGEAEAGHQATYGARSRVLGPGHPETLTSLADLAVVHAAMERLGQALAEFNLALDGLCAALGPDHPDCERVRSARDEIRRRLGESDHGSSLPVGGRAGSRRLPSMRKPSRQVGSLDIVSVRGQLPLVREIISARALGAPTQHLSHGGAPLGYSDALPYVPRDFDGPLRAALAGSGFVLLAGDALSGKTRSAFEAVIARLPDHIIIAPRRRSAVSQAVEMAAEQHRCVLWLDDLYQLAGPDGLASTQVNRLLRDPRHHRVIVACITRGDLDRFTDRSDSAARQANREVIARAHQFSVPREWTDQEMVRLTAASTELGPRHPLRQQLTRNVPLQLAGGADLLDSWRALHSDPRASDEAIVAAALVSAAVACRRVGMSNPLSRGLLSRIYHAYLPPGFRGGSDRSLEEAWHWVMEPHPVAAALTLSEICRGPAGSGEAFLDVCSYLVDEFDRNATPADQVPEIVLSACLSEAEAAEAMRIGQTASNYGLFRPALNAFSQAARDRTARLGKEHPDTLASRDKEARAWRFLGELSRAEEQHTEVLQTQQRVLGPTDHATLTSRDNRARVRRVLGRVAEAKVEHEEVLSIRSSLLGAEDADTLTTHNNLGRVHAALGELPSAEATFRAVAAARGRVLGEGHRDTLTSLADLAGVLVRSGQLGAAQDLLAAVVRGRTELLGPEHPSTRHSVAALAAVLPEMAGPQAEHRADGLATGPEPIRRATASDDKNDMSGHVLSARRIQGSRRLAAAAKSAGDHPRVRQLIAWIRSS